MYPLLNPRLRIERTEIVDATVLYNPYSFRPRRRIIIGVYTIPIMTLRAIWRYDKSVPIFIWFIKKPSQIILWNTCSNNPWIYFFHSSAACQRFRNCSIPGLGKHSAVSYTDLTKKTSGRWIQCARSYYPHCFCQKHKKVYENWWKRRSHGTNP